MITGGEKWHYLAVRSLSALLRGITSNHNRDFYCFKCFHSYCTDSTLKKHDRVCHKHDYCYIEMPNENNKILKYYHGKKSLKAPFTIYFYLECVLKKEQSCQNNTEKSYTEKKTKHEPSGWVMFTKCSFDEIEIEFDYYRGIDCIKRWCEKLRGRATEIINYKEKETIPLTDKENKSYKNPKVCHICKKEFCYDENNKKEFKKYQEVRDHCHYTGKFRGAAHSICNLSYKVPKKIHNGSTYVCHFIIKQLTEEFEGKFECLGENTEKYITFSVPVKKEEDDDNGEKEREDGNGEKEEDDDDNGKKQPYTK